MGAWRRTNWRTCAIDASLSMPPRIAGCAASALASTQMPAPLFSIPSNAGLNDWFFKNKLPESAWATALAVAGSAAFAALGDDLAAGIEADLRECVRPGVAGVSPGCRRGVARTTRRFEASSPWSGGGGRGARLACWRLLSLSFLHRRWPRLAPTRPRAPAEPILQN